MRFVGIDIGQASLDVAATEANATLPRRVPNTDPGIQQLVVALRALAPTLIVFEATGAYHRPLLAALVDAKLPVAVVNPAQVAAFRHARLGREKTDRTDAQLLARFAAVHGAELRPASLPDAIQARLHDLVTYRDQLVAERTRRRNQAHAASWGAEAQVQTWLAADLAQVETRLAEVDAAIAQVLAELPEAAELQTLTGVGPRVAAAVLGYLPRPIWGNAKAAAAYAGVHPRREQSGQRDHSRLSKHGHARLRRYLYVAATVAIRHDPDLQAFAERLQQRGHSPTSATCAVMHKLLRRMMGHLRAFATQQTESAVSAAA